MTIDADFTVEWGKPAGNPRGAGPPRPACLRWFSAFLRHADQVAVEYRVLGADHPTTLETFDTYLAWLRATNAFGEAKPELLAIIGEKTLPHEWQKRLAAAHVTTP